MKALILIGGKSLRMGTDKSKLLYYNKPQDAYIFGLLEKLIPKEHIYYAVRDDLQTTNQPNIVDVYPNLGPFGAVYSAFSADNSTAWLIIAIDMPFVSIDMIKLLINKRDPQKIATTFQGMHKKFPEPLITIWEPHVYPILKKSLKTKQYSLVNILKNNEVNIIAIEDEFIENINTKLAYKEVKKRIK